MKVVRSERGMNMGKIGAQRNKIIQGTLYQEFIIHDGVLIVLTHDFYFLTNKN